MRGALASWVGGLVVALLCRPDLTVGTAFTDGETKSQ